MELRPCVCQVNILPLIYIPGPSDAFENEKRGTLI